MARMAFRHRLILWSFLIVVALPTTISGLYLWLVASDQYTSTVAFSVRKEGMAAASGELFGGLGKLAGMSSTSDTDILYAYLRSEDIVARMDEKIDLRTRFAKRWPKDPVFAFNPSKPLEKLTKYWLRQASIVYDSSSRLISVTVSAFTPEDAYDIARAAFDESSRTINRLSDIAREDGTRAARAELDRAQTRLTEARQAMTAFRMDTQIVDPQADLAGQMGVLNSLQAQLAEQMIALDMLHENARPGDQRIIQAKQRIAAIRARIEEERAKFNTPGAGPGGKSYAEMMADYEKLRVALEFAEASHRSAQVAYEMASAEAERQSRYLAAHIEPKIAQSSTEPRRFYLLFSTFGGLILLWGIMLLVYYSVRDRR